MCTVQKPKTILSCPIWIAGTSYSSASEDKASSWDLWWCSDGFGVSVCFWGTFWSSRWISWRSDFRQVVIYVARCLDLLDVPSPTKQPNILGAPKYLCYKIFSAALICQCFHVHSNVVCSSRSTSAMFMKIKILM